MANGSKVFVSPGVYTSEKDLSFVAQSVGVTTLGLVGEALKGPAFEPIFISSYDDYITRFGGTSPKTFVDSQIPKYEMGYISKAYLSQANQLFVTRVLGLSGYDAGPSWSVQTIGVLDKTTVASGSTTSHTVNYFLGVSDTMHAGGNQNVASSIVTGTTIFTDAALTTPFALTGLTGGVNSGASISDFTSNALSTSSGSLVNLGTYVGTWIASRPTFNQATSAWSITSGVIEYGCGDPSAQITASIGTGTTTSTQILTDTVCSALTSYQNDFWYDGLFNYSASTNCCSGGTYDGISITISPGMVPLTSTTANVISGSVRYDIINYAGAPFADADGVVVATLRSRGVSTTASGGPVYTVSADTVDIDCTGAYADALKDPFKSFGITASTVAGDNYSFKTSMDITSKDYMSKVFGRSPFDKVASEVPIFLEEGYPVMLKHMYNQGKVRGLKCCLNYLPGAREASNTNTIGWYMNEWRTPETPWLVSELQGVDVYKLFKFISISDGTSANREYKVSISNLSFERGEFDIIVRDFYDTDSSPQILEKFTRCSMDPTKTSFVARKVGTSTGEFELKSNYIMLYLAEGVLDGTFVGSLPCGFEGYKFRSYGTCSINPSLQFKTKYYNPGDVVYEGPFASGTIATANQTLSGGDKVSKNYLGLSSSLLDYDFFDFKGFQVPTATCTSTEGDEWSVVTEGFHMDVSASGITGGAGTYLNLSATTLSGNPVFQCGAGQFSTEPTSATETYKKLRTRKFTLAPYGGFDGWDIYRKTRSNTDDYRMGLTGFLNGACTSSEFSTATGSGTFKKLSSTEANTDYFAYLRGINTFSNPEAIDINVFATPGINYVDNLGLVNEAIDMVESDRADSLYITTTPDYNMFVKSTTDITNMVGVEEAVDNMDDSLIDSNYTATYYPWIQVRDTANNKQIFIPPTAEVMRNIALTDNVSFPWFASAGYTRGIVNATKARKKLTLDERDVLYVGRINPIATFSDVGPIIWGNKTLQVKESALDRINVRRLLLQTRKLISAVSIRLIFEQNDDIVRQQFLDLVNPILDSIRRDRGLTDFRVVLSSDPEEIDRNEMSGKIYIKPTRALEYIYVEFLVTPTGASFEDV